MGDVERVKRLVAYYKKTIIQTILLKLPTNWVFSIRLEIVKMKAVICF